MNQAACTQPGRARVTTKNARRELITDRYLVARRLGHGGMGEVLLAHDLVLGRRVAIKRSHSAERDDLYGRKLRREARIAAKVSHRGVAQIHDIVRHASADHMVMELVEGPSLFELYRAGPVEPAEVVRIAIELARALAAVHRSGVLHLDLKLENVLLTPERQPKLIDFGIARCADEIDLELDPETLLIGTPRAMSPEQIQGDPVDARSDLYSLGVLLFELLAGTSPFAADDEQQTLKHVLRDCPPRVDSIVRLIPPALAQLVDDLLEKSPARRPHSAGELETRLWSIALALE